MPRNRGEKGVRVNKKAARHEAAEDFDQDFDQDFRKPEPENSYLKEERIEAMLKAEEQRQGEQAKYEAEFIQREKDALRARDAEAARKEAEDRRIGGLSTSDLRKEKKAAQEAAKRDRLRRSEEGVNNNVDAEEKVSRRVDERKAFQLRKERRIMHEEAREQKVALAREERMSLIEEEGQAPHPHKIMTDAIKHAEKGGSFDKNIFKAEMKKQFLGRGFPEFKRKQGNEMRDKLNGAEKKFDSALSVLADEVDKGIKNNTLKTQQENGTFRKCIRGVLHAVTALVSLASAYPAAVGYVAGAKMATTGSMAATAATVATKVGVGAATVGSAVGAGLGLATGGFLAYTIYKINSSLDASSPSSRVEDYMDKLVDTTNKAFGTHISELSEKGRESRKDAKRFQNRIERVSDHGRTFEGREKAKKEAQEKGEGQKR